MTTSSTLSPLQWINQCICHIGLYLFSYRLRCESVSMPGFSKVSFILCIVLMHHKLLLSAKNLGKFILCINFRALNAVTVHDSFPLPRIKEALQAVKAVVWFTSFDLAQGYLQLAMDEADIHKTAFQAGSSGLYEFTCMPFGLSNVGASFCRLMEMCLGDQQYITLLFYLNDICVFSSTVDEMLDHVGLVLNHLKEFNLKIKPKKTYFFQSSVVFLGHVLSKNGISPNLEKVS